jgi:hypothetical protein
MRKAKYISECCDVCGEYALFYEQALLTLVRDTGVVNEVFLVHSGHEGCAYEVEKYLAAQVMKWKCGLEVRRVDFNFVNSVAPKLELARILRPMLAYGVIPDEKLRFRVRKRLGDMQIILSPAPGVLTREDHYRQLQLDDVCNLMMLQKILKTISKPKVSDWGDQLVVEDSNRLRNGIATVISTQLANLVNCWGTEIIDAMITLQEAGIDAYTAITKLSHLVEEIGTTVEEATTALTSTMGGRMRKRL